LGAVHEHNKIYIAVLFKLMVVSDDIW